MKRTLNFIIPLEPEALKRPRVSFAQRRFYSDQEHERLAVGLYMSSAMAGGELFNCPISLRTEFYFHRPRGKKHYNMMYMPGFPDLDNLIKLIGDAGQGILWKNDSVICSIVAAKFYTDLKPYTFVEIKEL